jgi:hypothetical protein
MSDDDLIRRGDAKAWCAQYPYVKGLRDAIDAIPAAPLDALTLERAALVAEAMNNGETAKAIARSIRALAPEPVHVMAARVLLNSHTVQTMIAAGKRLDLEDVLRAFVETRHD